MLQPPPELKSNNGNAEKYPNLHEGNSNFDFDAKTRYSLRVKEAHERITKLRSMVEVARAKLCGSREKVQDRHSEIRDLEAQFWKELQRHDGITIIIEKATIETLYKQLVTALDELGPAEEDHMDEHYDLAGLESELALKEEEFYWEFSNPDLEYFANADYTTPPPMSPISDAAESGRSTPVPKDYYLLVEADEIRERIEKFIHERDRCLSIQGQRIALGVAPYQPNVDFLGDFENVYAGYLKQLNEVEDAISQQRKEDVAAKKPVHSKTSNQPKLSPPPSGPRKDTVKPQHFQFEGRKSDGDLLDVPVDSTNSRHRINQWILDSMNVSAFARARYQDILEQPSLKEGVWWNLALRHWQQDHAGDAMLSQHKGSLDYHCESQNVSKAPFPALCKPESASNRGLVGEEAIQPQSLLDSQDKNTSNVNPRRPRSPLSSPYPTPAASAKDGTRPRPQSLPASWEPDLSIYTPVFRSSTGKRKVSHPHGNHPPTPPSTSDSPTWAFICLECHLVNRTAPEPHSPLSSDQPFWTFYCVRCDSPNSVLSPLPPIPCGFQRAWWDAPHSGRLPPPSPHRSPPLPISPHFHPVSSSQS
ncbi:hypothetical protein MMC28_003212 [Mycoblastus sanguinarius]|nr:hypothetical protein [Mycoblastus sanguinarius]